MAERVGFEPTVPGGTHALQACTFVHSVTSPLGAGNSGTNHRPAVRLDTSPLGAGNSLQSTHRGVAISRPVFQRAGRGNEITGKMKGFATFFSGTGKGRQEARVETRRRGERIWSDALGASAFSGRGTVLQVRILVKLHAFARSSKLGILLFFLTLDQEAPHPALSPRRGNPSSPPLSCHMPPSPGGAPFFQKRARQGDRLSYAAFSWRSAILPETREAG